MGGVFALWWMMLPLNRWAEGYRLAGGERSATARLAPPQARSTSHSLHNAQNTLIYRSRGHMCMCVCVLHTQGYLSNRSQDKNNLSEGGILSGNRMAS